MRITTSIRSRIDKAFAPQLLEVVNQSHLHASHREGGQEESHFDVTIVSDVFLGKPAIARHRLVYRLLEDIKAIHALALHTYTTEEWHQKSKP